MLSFTLTVSGFRLFPIFLQFSHYPRCDIHHLFDISVNGNTTRLSKEHSGLSASSSTTRSTSIRSLLGFRRAGRKTPNMSSKPVSPVEKWNLTSQSFCQSLYTAREYQERMSGDEPKTYASGRSFAAGHDPGDSSASQLTKISMIGQADQEEYQRSQVFTSIEPAPVSGTQSRPRTLKYSLLTYSAPSSAGQNIDTNLQAFATNIIGDRDPLGTGIREYIDAKIAEARHNDKHTNDCVSGTPLAFPAKPSLKTSTDSPIPGTTPERIDAGIDVLSGPKHIGPFKIPASSLIYNLQRAIIVLLSLAFFVAALVGPKALFLMLRRVSVFLLGYRVLGTMLGWKHKAKEDLLLAPVLLIGESYGSGRVGILEGCRECRR